MRFIFRLIPGVYISTKAGCFSCCMLLLMWPVWIGLGVVGAGLYFRFSQYPTLWSVLAAIWVFGVLAAIFLGGLISAIRRGNKSLSLPDQTITEEKILYMSTLPYKKEDKDGSH